MPILEIMDGTRGGRSGSRIVGAVALVLLASGCTLVGYPGGDPGEVSAPTPAAPDYRTDRAPSDADVSREAIPAELPEVMRSDAGRTYEVMGDTYRVLGSPRGYRERGVASWYGEAFHGRPTASGEAYDMYRLSAAHRTLPLHTWVEVTNLDNRRSLVLRVNDRGPFVHTDERIIDLSWAAARELGVIGPGTAPVEVRALEDHEVAAVTGSR